MKINEKVKKCVAFMQYQMADGTLQNAGTVFFVGRDRMQNKTQYAVTARHVIEKVKGLGYENIFQRINLQDTTSLIETPIKSWYFHEDENVDLAVHPIGFSKDVDHLFFPESSFMNEATIKEYGVGCGDEVFITGLFKHHHGTNKNIPIVRIGNIAMLPGEKIQTKEHLMDAYLIESRSTGGLSGSPVFMNYGLMREFDGTIKQKQGELVPHLIGLIYGHYKLKIEEIDSIIQGEQIKEDVNAGIAIVTPINKLVDLMNDIEKRTSKKKVPT